MKITDNIQLTFLKLIEYILLMAISASVFFGFLLIVSVNNVDLPLLIDRIPIVNKIEIPENTNPLIQSEIIDFSDSNLENISVTLNEQGLYYYNTLNPRMKNCFDNMYYGVTNFKSKIKFSEKISLAEFETLVYILQFDCPELFNIDLTYNYDIRQGIVIAFYPDYSMTQTEYKNRLSEINKKETKILSEIKGMSQLEAEIYIHDYILLNTVYDLNSPNNDTIYGCLINKKASCKGYTSTFNYLLRKAGIECTSVIGEVTSSTGITTGHSWNLIKIDGQYLYTDICWNDIAPSQEYNDIDFHYAFFNMTYKEMLNNRNIAKQLKYLGDIPKTESTNLSIYKKEGLYASNYNEAKKIIEEKLPSTLSSQEKYFVIQCKNEETYNKLINNVTKIIKELINNGEIKISSCKYSKIDSGYTLIIHNFS